MRKVTVTVTVTPFLLLAACDSAHAHAAAVTSTITRSNGSGNGRGGGVLETETHMETETDKDIRPSFRHQRRQFTKPRRRRQRQRHIATAIDEEGERDRFLEWFLQDSSTVDAESACKASLKTEQEAGAEFGAVCDCRPHRFDSNDNQAATQHAILSCADTACWYCNEEATACDEFSYGVIFDAQGMDIAYWEQDSYKVGRNEVVKYTEYAEDQNVSVDVDCLMEINGQACATCQFVDCMDDYYGIDVDCTNLLLLLEDAAKPLAFNTCDDENENDGGSSMPQDGVFQLFHTQNNGYCYGPSDGCEWDKQLLEEQVEPIKYACECTEPQEDGAGVQLSCQTTCDILICNPQTGSEDTCITEERITQTYQTLLKDSRIRTVTMNEPSIDVTIEESICDETGCQKCKAKIADTECTVCNMQPCSRGADGGASDMMMPFIDCSNIEIESEWKNEIIDLCGNTTRATTGTIGTPFDYFPDRHDNSTAYQCMTTEGMACLQAKELHESNDPHLECTCSSTSDSTGEESSLPTTTFSCFMPSCGDVCNSDGDGDGDFCFRETLEIIFTIVDGEAVSTVSRSIQYTSGLRQTLLYTEDTNDSCELTVDNVKCNACRKDKCGGDGSELTVLFDCSNIDPTAIVNSCDRIDSTSNTDGTNTNTTHTTFLVRFTNNEWEDCQVRSSANTHCAVAELLALPLSGTGDRQTEMAGSTLGLLPTGNDGGSPIDCKNNTNNASPGLWYSVLGRGTGLKASVCNEKTDFDARLSVIGGGSTSSCDSFNCVETIVSDSNCSIMWLASSDSMYYIHVHGANEGEENVYSIGKEIGSSTGNFVLTISEFDYAEEQCQRRKEAFESLDTKQYSCECSSDDYSLRCENACLLCDDAMTICGMEQVHMEFHASSGTIAKQTDSFQYYLGRTNNTAITVEQTFCNHPLEADCQPTCHGAVDGVPCDNCRVVSCDSGGTRHQNEAFMGLEVNCENVDSTFYWNTCDSEDTFGTTSPLDFVARPSEGTGLATLLHQDKLTQCVAMDGQLACRHEESILSISNVESMECKCQENDEEPGEFHLTCVDTSCLKCSEERRFCGYDTIKSDFSLNGDQGQHYNGFLVMEGNVASTKSSAEKWQIMELSDCAEVQDPLETCTRERNRIMSADPLTDCECKEASIGDGSYDLVCYIASSCEYCNENESVCAHPMQYGHFIDQFGRLTTQTHHTLVYTEGRDEIIMVDRDDDSCVVSINGQQCSRCEYIQCNQASFDPRDVDIATSLTRSAGVHTQSFRDMYIDCSNVFEQHHHSVSFACGVAMIAETDGNATILPGADLANDDTGLFAVLSGNLRLSCHRNETFVGTVAPSTNQSDEENVMDTDDIVTQNAGAETARFKLLFVFGCSTLLLFVY